MIFFGGRDLGVAWGLNRMHLSLAILSVAMAAVPDCAGLPAANRSDVDAVIIIAGTTLIHIKMLNVTSSQSINTPDMSGLSNTSYYLGLLESELDGHQLPSLSQIKADVSSLRGRVRSLAWMAGCVVPDAPEAPPGNGDLFPDSQLQQTLMKVRDYLEKFKTHQCTLTSC